MDKPFKIVLCNKRAEIPITEFEINLTEKQASQMKAMLGCTVTLILQGVSGLLLKVVPILETVDI